MVISHKHKYVFLELPYTGTRAVSDFLCRYYEGEKILSKHANYHEFAKRASPREKAYFVFGTIRNPLEIPISLYFKYQNRDVSELWLSDPGRANCWNLTSRIYDWHERKKVCSAKGGVRSFEGFFLKHFRLPYDNWSRVSFKYCSYVMRFERLESDLEDVFAELGLVKEAPLPWRGNVMRWSHDPEGFYEGKARERAKWVFGPYMRRWGYNFPSEWGLVNISASAARADAAMGWLRGWYWRSLRGLVDRKLVMGAKGWKHSA